MVMILEKEERSMVIASTLVMQGVGANIPKVMSTVVIQSYSEEKHYLKSVHIRSFYGPYFPNFTGPYLFRKFSVFSLNAGKHGPYRINS